MHLELRDLSIPIGAVLAVVAAILRGTAKTSSKVTLQYADMQMRLKRCEEDLNKLAETHRKHIESQEAKENELSTQVNNLALVMERVVMQLKTVEKTMEEIKVDIRERK